jgi:MFS family permease
MTFWWWGVARMVAGMAVALMFAAVESWISFSIGKHARGEVMSVYMVLTKGALALGPFLAFGYAAIGSRALWMIAAALAALSMVPLCFTAAEQPDPPKAQPLALVEQFAIAPAAVIGCFGAGLVNGGVLALAPLYAAEHYGPNAAAEFYSAAFTGSLLAAMARRPLVRSDGSPSRDRRTCGSGRRRFVRARLSGAANC